MCVCVCVCMYVCMYVCMCVCVFEYIYIYIVPIYRRTNEQNSPWEDDLKVSVKFSFDYSELVMLKEKKSCNRKEEKSR